MRFKHMLSGIAAAAMLAVPIVQPGNLPLGATTVQAREANVSINIFFDALSEDGEWIDYAPYGYVWAPSDVPADWAPYTRGHWAYTERYGWTFVSDEPFAWAVYHYGRWGYDQDIGWFWVPGRVWAPAWVSWRRSDDVVGWAPLPPEDEGYADSAEVSYAEPPRHYWHFVPAPEFLAPDLAVVIVHDEAPFDETEDVGPVVVHNNIVVNNRIDVRYVEQVTAPAGAGDQGAGRERPGACRAAGQARRHRRRRTEARQAAEGCRAAEGGRGEGSEGADERPEGRSERRRKARQERCRTGRGPGDRRGWAASGQDTGRQGERQGRGEDRQGRDRQGEPTHAAQREGDQAAAEGCKRQSRTAGR